MDDTAFNDTAFIVDRQLQRREDTLSICLSATIRACAFPTIPQFRSSFRPEHRGCVVIVRDPTGDTDELRFLAKWDTLDLPCIFVCDVASAALAVCALRKGAADALMLPFDPEDLVHAIQRCFVLNSQLTAIRKARLRFQYMSDTEQAVMALISDGVCNRGVASRLDVGVRTVERVRSRILQKAGASNWIELVKMYTLAFGRVRLADPVNLCSQAALLCNDTSPSQMHPEVSAWPATSQ